MSNLIRANYEELEQIAKQFNQEAERTQQTLSSISATMNQLREEGWIGRGSESFFHEMDELILPAVRRLIEALSETGSMTSQTRSIMADAEDVASTEFITDEGNNAGRMGDARAGSGGGGAGSGGSGTGSGSTASAFDPAGSSRSSSNNTPTSSFGGGGSSTYNADATPSVSDSTGSGRSSSGSMPPSSSGGGGGSTFDNTEPSSSGSPSSGGGGGGSSSGGASAAPDTQTGGANNSPPETTSPGGTSPADANGATDPSGAQHSSVAGGTLNNGAAPTITAANPLDIGIDNIEQTGIPLGLAAASPAAAVLGKALLDKDDADV